MQCLCFVNTLVQMLQRIQYSQTSTENYLFNLKAIFSVTVQKQLTGFTLRSSRNRCKADLFKRPREGKKISLRKLLLTCNCASASWTSQNLVKVRRLGDFSPFLNSASEGYPASPLQLVINGDQALELCFHKVLLGQQSHQLGCLKFYHQHSSNKCWPERLLLFGNSCSLSL